MKAVPYEYAAQLAQGDQIAFNGALTEAGALYFNEAARWYRFASEHSPGQQPHLMTLERSNFMLELGGTHKPSHEQEVENVLASMKSLSSTTRGVDPEVVLARSRVDNGIWAIEVLIKFPELTWRTELIDHAFAWLLAAQGSLSSAAAAARGHHAEAFRKEVDKIEGLRAELGQAIQQ